MLLGMVDKRRITGSTDKTWKRVLKIRTIGIEALVSVAGGTLKTFKKPEQDATHYYHYFPLQLEKEKNRI